ncbi:PorP/SprF family type IX secretion system membrane protein [Aureispira]|nr:PorP/SprF family type IX secretion system membrane protein [Aureispira sp.]
MIKIIRKFIAVSVLFSAFNIQAQQLPILNHYIYNPYLYNPARTGQTEVGSLSFHFKKQWTSMPNSPFTGALSMESPVKTEKLGNMGLGGLLYVDQVHITTNIGGMATYAYHIPFVKGKGYKHGLSAGISLGFVHQRINYPDAIVADPNDNQLLPTEGSGTSFDFSAGLDYQWKGLHIGASMLQGLNTGLKLLDKGQDDIKYVNTRQWIVAASYKHLFGPEEKQHRVYLQPVFMGRIIENIPFQAEGNLIVGLDGMGWLGVGYRSSNNTTATSSIDITLGVEVQKQFVFAYTFGIGVDANLNTNMGTQHEFMLAYRFGASNQLKEIEKSMQVLHEQTDSIKMLMESESIKNQERFDSLTTIIHENNDKIEKTLEIVKEQGASIDQNKEALKKHDDEIQKNREEIEHLRKLVEAKPLQFKKVGEVFFDIGSEKLSDISKANLDAVKKVLDDAHASGNEIKVYIKGNSSVDGDAKRNMELSMHRAAKVRQYLVNQGYDGSHILVIPMGEHNPTHGYDPDEKGHSKDRRVDVIFTEKKE